jgi:aryl-alcohol dehydrogenase-like predicted oxidoreductase
VRYRTLGQHTGLRVSELVLGAGNFGTAWGYGAARDESRRIFEDYADAGGNFLDTADGYQFGESEGMLGDFLTGRRDQFVVASKYSLGAGRDDHMLSIGNSRRAMLHSVEASLKRLKTDRLDLFCVHLPDSITPMDEIMRGLDDLVHAGKVIYIGLSNFPAWRVAWGAAIAELRGWTPLAALQVEYSLVERSADRELLPMARALGLGALGWSPLGGGLLTGKYRRGEEGRAHSLKILIHAEDSEQKRKTIDTLDDLSKETGASMGALAIAWLIAQEVFPIIGPRTAEQLADNLSAAEISLTEAQIQRLSQVSAIQLGFPYSMVNESRARLSGSAPEDHAYPFVSVA